MFIFRAADWIACLFAEMSFTCYFKTEESTNQTEQTASSSDRGEKAGERAQRMLFFFFFLITDLHSYNGATASSYHDFVYPDCARR